tara:strand:+ start:169 stop:570 length:402 start_codon:yes stop_codon:yes gene_type:complete
LILRPAFHAKDATKIWHKSFFRKDIENRSSKKPIKNNKDENIKISKRSFSIKISKNPKIDVRVIEENIAIIIAKPPTLTIGISCCFLLLGLSNKENLDPNLLIKGTNSKVIVNEIANTINPGSNINIVISYFK